MFFLHEVSRCLEDFCGILRLFKLGTFPLLWERLRERSQFFPFFDTLFFNPEKWVENVDGNVSGRNRVYQIWDEGGKSKILHDSFCRL